MDTTDTTDTANVAPNQNSTAFLELEGLIKRYVGQIENLKEELKKQKEMLDDAFGNDAVYKEQEEKAKEAVGVKSATKQQILQQPVLVETREKIDDLRTQIKEAEEVLSDYLIQFQKSTGFNEIEADNGETLIIVNHAKLVKGSLKDKS